MNNPSSKNKHDQAIDDTLSALRGIRPPVDLELIVTQALRQRSAARSLSARSRAQQFLRAPYHGWALPAACALTITATAFALFRYVQRQPSGFASTSPTPPAIRSHQQAALFAAAPYTPPAPPQQRPRRRTEPFSQISVAREHVPAQVPPLPAPLTQQERLLQQIVRSHNPGGFAMLNPELLAQQEAENEAEFHNFFSSSSATKHP